MISQNDLKSLLNVEELEKLLKDYSCSSGLDVTLYGKDGGECFAVRGNGCVCNYAKGASICRKNVVLGGMKAHELGAPYIYETPCGLVMCIVAIVLSEEIVGFISVGPVILWDNDEYFQEEFKQKNAKSGLFLEGADLSSMKKMECESMTGSARMLMILLNYLIKEEHKFLARRQEVNRLNLELMKTRKEMEISRTTGDCKRYPIEMEKELIGYVHLGDKNNARKIINNFLNDIFSYASGDLAIIKAKLYEFTAFLSRAAVESGAPVERLKEVVKTSSKILLENIDFADLCQTTVEILERYIDIVYASKKSTSAHITNAIAYIQAHYNEKLDLSTLASEVFVSTYYLSHLFRDEMNTTFSDYLNKVRVDKAKSCLIEGKSVTQACEEVGYNEVNYFNKIFKKLVGITPAKYRKTTK